MQFTKLSTMLVLGAGLAAGCGDNAKENYPLSSCAKIKTGTCVQVEPGDGAALNTMVNTLSANTTIVLGAGTYQLTAQLTIRSEGVHLIGQGRDVTTLDFAGTTAQGDGVNVMGNDFLIQDLTVRDSKKDGIRVESSKGVVYRNVRVTWSKEGESTNGAYGIYPVKSENVLVEDCEVSNASDAGLYVGQSQRVIVRNNKVTGNVAGLEIENTQYADVYNNTAENNTAGIVVFDLPGNPIVGHDIRLRNNTIRGNNHLNFAPGGVVASIPPGTGTFAMASRRVEITNNTYANNDTADISVISGLALEEDPAKWMLDKTMLSGNLTGVTLDAAGGNMVMNFRSANVLISGNTHTGSGTRPGRVDDPLMFGLLLSAVYQGQPVDSVLYDAIGESKFDSTVAAENSNDNHICVGGNTNGTYATTALALQTSIPPIPFYRPAKPFAPFDCTALTGGPVAPVTL